MKRILFFTIPAILILASCRSNASIHLPTDQNNFAAMVTPHPFIITDFKNKAQGLPMPAWVEYWLEGGVNAIETSGLYENRHAFVSRNEGSNFNALNQWVQWFSPELDFPRVATSRIEARFLYGVARPDSVYGDFFISMIRAASDAPWTGAVKQDYFWIRRQFSPPEDEFWEMGGGASFVEEDWKFMILLTMEEDLFASQLAEIFRRAQPVTRPTRQQIAAVNNVVDRFFEGF
jgi:hypothetical protein